MKHTRTVPPQLCSAKDCDASLCFDPQTPWPDGLPAVALNKFILAGWGQSLVFNHTLDVTDKNEIASLVRSLYFELSFGEIAHLIKKTKKQKWFPIEEVIRKFNMIPSEQFMRVAALFVKLPVGFQQWCMQRKVSAQELLPLLHGNHVGLKPVLLKILNSQLTRTQGATALELCIDLLLLGRSLEELHLTENHLGEAGHLWSAHLKNLRFPQAPKRDWPGTSQARWNLAGKKMGLELKLFVADPASDLVDSKTQDLLEKQIIDPTKPN